MPGSRLEFSRRSTHAGWVEAYTGLLPHAPGRKAARSRSAERPRTAGVAAGDDLDFAPEFQLIALQFACEATAEWR